ncbi:MAG: hypothetical protein KatS3mg102_1015 [Planctomycetota bacterium]|nr:MAG: hypothetical protein KatS3mg102_1015 [Planctomycetota bacterium]
MAAEGNEFRPPAPCAWSWRRAASAACALLGLLGVNTCLHGQDAAGVTLVWLAAVSYPGLLALGQRLAAVDWTELVGAVRAGAARLGRRLAPAPSQAPAGAGRRGRGGRRGAELAPPAAVAAAPAAPAEAGGAAGEREQTIQRCLRYQACMAWSVLLAAVLAHLLGPGLAAAAFAVAPLAVVSGFIYRHGAILLLLGRRLRVPWANHAALASGFVLAGLAAAAPEQLLANLVVAAAFGVPIGLVVYKAIEKAAPRALPQRAPMWPLWIAGAMYAMAVLA